MNKEALDAVDELIKEYSNDIKNIMDVTELSDKIRFLATLIVVRARIRD